MATKRKARSISSGMKRNETLSISKVDNGYTVSRFKNGVHKQFIAKTPTELNRIIKKNV